MPPNTIDFTAEYTRQTGNLGSNQGGFFKHNESGQECYVKWLPASDTKNVDRLKNEFLALKLYELFGVNVPKGEIFQFTNEKGQEQVGIITPKIENVSQVSDIYGNKKAFDAFRKKAQEDFLIDSLLANYDVVGLAMDNLHYNTKTGEPFRIDPGGALRYRAQGGDKWAKGQFNESADEFEEMESGINDKTRYNQLVLQQSSAVFKGVHESPSLAVGLHKLESISEEQIRKCVEENFHDNSSEEGRLQNEKMIDILLARRNTLILKAQQKLDVQAKASPEPVVPSHTEPETESLYIEWYEKSLQELGRKVAMLSEKAEADPDVYQKYYQTSNALLVNLKADLNAYKTGGINEEALAAVSRLHIEKAEPVLTQEPGQTSYWNRFTTFMKKIFSFGLYKTAKEKTMESVSGFQKKLEEVNDSKLNAKEVVTEFNDNPYVVKACVDMEPETISKASPDVAIQFAKDGFIEESVIAKFVQSGAMSPVDAVKEFPGSESVILESYKKAPMSIQHANTKMISSLVDTGHIKPEDAVKAFHDDIELIESICFKTLNTPEEMIEAINEGRVSVDEIVKEYPSNPDIIKAAYDKSPESIQFADKEVIDQLGASGLIRKEDVLSIFSLSEPDQMQKEATATEFNMAKSLGNWEKVAKICQKFWFEKPSNATHAKVSQELMDKADGAYGAQKADYMKSLYDFESHFKSEDYVLTAGPLQKKPETYQLEELMRKLLKNPDFKQESKADGDYFVFSDGTEFNWTKIRENADMQHIQLNEQDMEAYKRFESSYGNPYSAQSNLNRSEEKSYRDKLYQEYDQAGRTRPDPPISFQEMQAINIYTGGYYTEMNGLMRDEKSKFDYRTSSPADIRPALIHSVMCASALRKIPETNIQTSYRGAKLGTKQEQRERVEAAAKNGVVELSGFVSTSANENAAFGHKPVIFKFQNLRGAYVEPITKVPGEYEFLIPKTQIQVTSYQKKGGKQHFEATLVSDLAYAEKDGFKPSSISLTKANTELLKHASPKVIADLVGREKIAPSKAIHIFPKNEAVILASYRQNPDSILHADKAVKGRLIDAGRLPRTTEAEIEPSKPAGAPTEKDSRSIESTQSQPVSSNSEINMFLKKMYMSSFRNGGKADEALVRKMFKKTCSKKYLGGVYTKFSDNTKQAKEVIKSIKDNKVYCGALGIDYDKPDENKVNAIKSIMKKAYKGEPIFPKVEKQSSSQLRL